MRYFSLFSGIGGFEHGIEKASKYLQKWRTSRANIQRQGNCTNFFNREKGWNSKYTYCVGYSEINKYAEAIYRFHYPKQQNYGDARRIVPKELPDFDLLCAGFPCQSFSIAGKRKGFDDTRGTLFFEICKIARVKKPDYLLLENVRGLLSHDEGRTFLVILQSLDELGYDLQWQVLNSKDWGVPQNRERVFIIGNIRGKSRPEIFPIQKIDKKNKKKGEGTLICEIDKGQSYRFYNPEGISPTLSTPTGGHHIPKIMNIPHGWNKGIIKQFPNLRAEGNSQHNELLLTDHDIRRLTPLECERLQGFPDNWTKWGIMNGEKVEISDTQRYKCLGNAVTTNVITAIMERCIY